MRTFSVGVDIFWAKTRFLHDQGKFRANSMLYSVKDLFCDALYCGSTRCMLEYCFCFPNKKIYCLQGRTGKVNIGYLDLARTRPAASLMSWLLLEKNAVVEMTLFLWMSFSNFLFRLLRDNIVKFLNLFYGVYYFYIKYGIRLWWDFNQALFSVGRAYWIVVRNFVYRQLFLLLCVISCTSILFWDCCGLLFFFFQLKIRVCSMLPRSHFVELQWVCCVVTLFEEHGNHGFLVLYF